MPAELTLFFTDENGQEQQVIVNANPFTIGRQDGNNLVLRDSGLSRRHALITSFNDVAQLSDCGSQNGTFLNGKQLTGAAVLKHGDQISMGENCHLRVQVRGPAAATAPSQSAPPAAPKPVSPAPPATDAPSKNTASADLALPSLSPALIATLATVGIVVIAALLIGLVWWNKSKPPAVSQDVVFVENPTPSSTTEAPADATPAPTAQTTSSSSSDPFEKSLVQVIRNISNDSSYPFPPAVVTEVQRKAQQFATPTLASTLRSIATNGDSAINQIKAQGLKKPALLVYMALAETNGSGDVLGTARALVPEVQFLRGHFGSEFADPTLIVVAAYKIPGGSKRSHPLLPRLNQLVKNPQTDRNVWFLREKGALSDGAFDYLLRFLAYGAIAQNPRQFGLDAPALVF